MQAQWLGVRRVCGTQGPHPASGALQPKRQQEYIFCEIYQPSCKVQWSKIDWIDCKYYPSVNKRDQNIENKYSKTFNISIKNKEISDMLLAVGFIRFMKCLIMLLSPELVHKSPREIEVMI